MSRTSQKHKEFIAEPMGEKEITCVAGIGEVLGKRLQDKGYDKVKFVFYIYTLRMLFKFSFITVFYFFALAL